LRIEVCDEWTMWHILVHVDIQFP